MQRPRNGAEAKPKGNELQSGQQLFTPSKDSAQGPTHRHHADSLRRRPKTLQELIDGAELIELLDRRSPGWQVRGRT